MGDPDTGTTFLYFVPDSEKAKVEAACKLEENFARVLQDITNQEPTNIDGEVLTQPQLKRVDPKHVKSVEAMLKAVCSRLRGEAAPFAPSKDNAQAWEQAAKFLAARVQGSKEEMPGRDPDMSLAAATAMKTVLGHIEVASKLTWNRETIVKDIVNQGPRGVKGGELSQVDLKRLENKYQGAVDAMLREVCDRLLGKSGQMPSDSSQVLVWADAA